MASVNPNKMIHQQSLETARSLLSDAGKKEFDLLVGELKDKELVELLKRNNIEIVIYPDKSKTQGGWAPLKSIVFHGGEIAS